MNSPYKTSSPIKWYHPLVLPLTKFTFNEDKSWSDAFSRWKNALRDAVKLGREFSTLRNYSGVRKERKREFRSHPNRARRYASVGLLVPGRLPKVPKPPKPVRIVAFTGPTDEELDTMALRDPLISGGRKVITSHNPAAGHQ